MWAACTTHPTWQIDRLREDRERREAAQTDQVAPLQLKAGITAGTKMLQVRDSWQLLHQRLTRGQDQRVSRDSSASLLCCSTKTELSSFAPKGQQVPLLRHHFSSTAAFPDKDTKILKREHVSLRFILSRY